VSMELYQAPGHGPNQHAEETLAGIVLVALHRAYPGYDWLVTVNFIAGVMNLDLICEKPAPLRGHGYLLHLSSLMSAGGERKVLNAGGEMLERFGLRRDRADAEWRQVARENGLEMGGAVLKSRH
jgi:hypothetical protein